MKRTSLPTIAFFVLFLVPALLRSQSLSLLMNLHPRPHVSYFYANSGPGFPFQIAGRTIIIDTAPTAGTLRALAYFQKELRILRGDTIPVTSDLTKFYFGGVVVLGEKSESLIQRAISESAFNDSLHPEGYLLDVNGNVVLAGADSSGTFNGISTLIALMRETKDSVSAYLPHLHINDWPDYPIRWVFSTHNLITQPAIAELKGIEDTMAAHKLNGLQQNDFKNNILDVFSTYPQYFYNVDSLQAYSSQSNVELIPGLFPIGWSEGILFHDPDLAEGIPTTASFLIQADTGTLLGDPRVTLPHGDFENASNGSFPGWNWYDPTIFVDSSNVHRGRYSARATNFSDTTPNGRFIKFLPCSPHTGYHLSAWYNTKGFQGEFNLLAIGFHGSDSRTLTFTQFSVPATSNGWQQANVVFNTLEYDSLYVYCGVWSGQAGTIWMDDFQIEDAGLTNLLRRPSDLPTVTGKAGTYSEGRDYATIADSTMEQAQGTYRWHPSPGLKVLSGSRIQNGDTVEVHFIRPNPVVNDITGDGSTMACISEDTLYSILQDQMHRVDAQYHSGRYFMSHDEIREMNWDSACQDRKISPGELLADNVRKCDSIMHEVHPGTEVFDWSDMFDSLHNAHSNYYLVNGDLSGDWNLIPKDLTIVNWNGGRMSQSLSFFSKLGFSQITSPYYDIPNTNNIRAWRLAMDTIPDMRGMMYTTWADDYSFLTAFADYAWSAGPMIVHTPIDSATVWNDYPYPVSVTADVFADPYDPTDSIVTVWLLSDFGTKIAFDSMKETSEHHYGASLGGMPAGIPKGYWIEAQNTQGLVRRTPEYILETANSSGVSPAKIFSLGLSIFPNPVLSTLTVRRDCETRSTIMIEDLMGREVARFETSSCSSILDLEAIPPGIYQCVTTEADGRRESVPFVKE